MMNKNIDVVDLFDEEMNKKDKRIERKVEKARIREQRKEEKRKKRLEKEEDSNFQKYLEKVKEEKGIEETIEISPKVEDVIIDPIIPDVPIPVKEKKSFDIQEIIPDISVSKVPKKHPFLNFLIVLFSVFLFVVSVDFIIYNTYTNYVDFKTMITSIILVSTVIFYILSIIIKSEGIKKFFQILSLILFTCYMCYYLFIA